MEESVCTQTPEFSPREEGAEDIIRIQEETGLRSPAAPTCPAGQDDRLALLVPCHGDDRDLILRPGLQTWKQGASAGPRYGLGTLDPQNCSSQGGGWGAAGRRPERRR